jgi:hypothetical protein
MDNPDTEGMLIAGHCLLTALIPLLVSRGVLARDDLQPLAGEALECLAALKPVLMTPQARNYARNVLQSLSEDWDHLTPGGTGG